MGKLIGEKLKYYKDSLILTKVQREIIVGTLLGDSSMELRNRRPVYSLKFEQSFSRKEYIEHIYSIFSDWTGTGPKIRIIPNDGKFKERKSIWFRTYRHSSFRFYYGAFYSSISEEKKKVVPKLIHRFLTPRSLAYWFMDDGSCHEDKYGNK